MKVDCRPDPSEYLEHAQTHVTERSPVERCRLYVTANVGNDHLYSGEETLVVKSKGQEAGSRNQRDRSPRDRSIHISSVSQEKYDSAQVVATHRGVWEKRREAQYQAMLDVHEFV